MEKSLNDFKGLVAQWITRLTTDQKIPGSLLARSFFLCNFFQMALLQFSNFGENIILESEQRFENYT
jgi:hypothetical protein